MAGTKATSAPKTPKVVAPTEKQLAVLTALQGGRKVVITDDGKKKTVSFVTKAGKPVKDAPKVDRVAIETCQKKGWVSAEGILTDEGKKAKKAK